jgi:hypothetical protein
LKLSTGQEALISRLASLKETYDRDLATLQAEFDAAKEELKNPIRQAVVEAQEAGVPTRQIHQRGLGWAQVASMVNFLEVKPETLGQRLKRLTQTVTATPVGPNGTNSGSNSNAQIAGGVAYERTNALKLIDHGRGIWSVFDRVGDEWKFTFSGVHNGGPHIMFAGHEAFELSEDGAEIRQAILDKFPTMANVDKEYQTKK